MSVFRPANGKILLSILLELEKSILPEVTSERARFMGKIVTYLMQALIIRENDMADILDDELAAETEQLGIAARLLGRGDLERMAASLAELKPGDVHGPDGLSHTHDRAAAALETALQAVMSETADQTAVADLLKQVLASEVTLLDRLEPRPQDAAGHYTASLWVSDDITPDRLNAYFGRGRFRGKEVTATRVDRLLGGFSKDTYIAHLAGADRPAEQIVIRRDCLSGPIDASVVDEYPIAAGLHRTGFPVAEPLWVEAEPGALGTPFMVVRKVPGRVFMHSDGFTYLAPHDEVAAIARQFARVLARLHTADLRALGYAEDLANLPAREHVRRQIDEFETYWRQHRQGPEPILAAAFEWLRLNLPAVVPGPCVVHGDASLRNLLVEGGQVSAMLDWETVHIGDPSEDLAYCRRDVEPVLPWTEFLAEYYDQGGPEYREENARFFHLWARVRNAAFSLAHGFEHAAVPDMRFAYTSAIYHRGFLREIAEFLNEVHSV